MGRFWSHRPPGRHRDAAARRRRRLPLEVCPLEARELTTILGISAQTDTTILTPPNGRLVPITVSGTISDDGAAVPILELHVIDEYRRINTALRVPLVRREGISGQNRIYDYSRTVHLEASRAEQDRAGRQYYIILTVKDPDNAAGRIIPLLVPYDPRHVPRPEDGGGDEVTRPPRAGIRPRPPRADLPGSGRPTGRRGGPR